MDDINRNVIWAQKSQNIERFSKKSFPSQYSFIKLLPMQINGMTWQEVNCHGWPGYAAVRGALRIVVCPCIGGRMMSLMYDGHELLFVQSEHAGEVFDFSNVGDLNAVKRQLGFRFWGGEKTWLAPQSAWREGIPPLELDAGPYTFQIEGARIIMESPVCRETGVQIQRMIEVEEGPTIRIEQSILNCSPKPVRRGIWNVIQLTRPLDIGIPTHPESMRSYHREDPTLPNPAITPQFENGLWHISCRTPDLFKFGGFPTEGRLFVERRDLSEPLRVEVTFALNSNSEYAHKSAVEIFNSHLYNYCEVETHAPLQTLQSGEAQKFVQYIRIGNISRQEARRECSPL